ncbi:hypothetical protein E3N88_06488 [Mikania micrantha]|uniref:Uncharacterized protein n=1 Tax=Mikania micrantha TaxID=192012 RepID=A0A5N6PPT2_9ASTR|nr:hypothetical protein E3N88_06488 [Mikania micrantha]
MAQSWSNEGAGRMTMAHSVIGGRMKEGSITFDSELNESDPLYFRVEGVEGYSWVQEWLDFMEYCSRYGGLKVVDGRVFSKSGFRFKREEEDEKNEKDDLIQGIYTSGEFGFVFVARFSLSLRFRNLLAHSTKLI